MIKSNKRSPFTAILIMVILTIIGVALLPRVDVRYKPTPKPSSNLTLNFSWPGASARVVEQEVTSRLEGVLSAIEGVDGVTSTSSYGQGDISITLKKGVNKAITRFEISSLLKQISLKLPEGVSYPTISGEGSSSDKKKTTPLLSYRINANMRKDQIKDYADKNIKPLLDQIENVAKVEISGQAPQILEIKYNPQELQNYGLSVSDLSNGISSFLGRNTIVGDIEQIGKDGNSNKMSIWLESVYNDSDLNKIPIKKIDDKIIYLGSLVDITYKDRPETNYYRINGLNTATLNIEIDAEASVIPMSKIVREEMDEICENLISGYELELITDEAKEIKEEITKLVRRTLLSLIILLVFVWIISRSLKYLTIIAITLFSNVFISVILYYIFNIQLNVLSLAGIAVSFGIIIDTTIVMVDHYSYYKNRSVFLAILASLLTTIGSLIIVFFMPEHIQNDLKDFSAIIIVNLSISLIVSLFFVPAIIDKFNYSRIESLKKVKTRRSIIKLSNFYKKYIHFTQKRKWIYITLMVLAFGIPLHLLPRSLGTTFHNGEPWHEPEWYEKAYNYTFGSKLYQQKLKEPLELILGGSLRLFSTGGRFRDNFEQRELALYIGGSMPDGSTAEEMNEKVLQIDAFLANFSEIKRFTTNVSPGNAQIYVTFKDEFINTAFPFTLENQVVRKMESIGGADWRTFGVSQRGYSISLGVDSKTNRIEITGYNYDRLTQIAENLIIELEKNKRVADVEVETNIEFRHPSLREKRQEMHIKYDPKSLAIYDFNPSQGYSELSSRLSVTSGGRYTNGGNNTDISLVSSQASKFNKWKLLNSYIPVNGTSTRYSHFGEIGVRKAKSVIKKENQEYSIEVGFNYNGNYKLAEEFMKKTIAGLNKSLPIGFRTANTSYGHYNDNGSQYLLLFIIAVIIFFVCSILFESIRQPMVIIALIPLSYIGTFLIFPLTGINFGNGGFASLVLLSGLVVNAAIYIINEYNNTRQVSGRDLIKIYVKAFNHKIIPIILTVVSTVLGLLPFLVDKVKEEFWYSFAIGTISGLLFSVIALVLFMPILMPLKVGQPLVVPDR